MKPLLKEAGVVSLEKVPQKVRDIEKSFAECMDDNFNTPKVISELSDAFRELNKVLDSRNFTASEKAAIFVPFLASLRRISGVLRVFEEDPEAYVSALKTKVLSEKGIAKEFVEGKIVELLSAKAVKDYQKADAIKRELNSAGIKLLEQNNAVRWELLYD
jgi:cysteinyl-tRNA synthetase